MKKSTIKLFIILFFTHVSIFPVDRHPVDSTVYLHYDYNSLSSGETPNYLSKPYSSSFLPGYKTVKGTYLQSNISFSPRFNWFSGEQITNLEYLYYSEWLKLNPLINLGFSVGSEIFTFRYDLDIRHDFFSGYNSDTYLNIPTDESWYLDFDFNFPIRGYLTVGNETLNLFVGRDKISYGPGKRTNLMLSKETPFFNQLTLTYYSKKNKTSLFFIPMESYLTDSEKTELENFISNNSDLLLDVNYGKDYDSQSTYITGHRFEFRPVRNFILTFTEMLVLGGRFNNLEDITPAMFYHNVYGENYSNVMLGFDFYYAVVPGLGLYGEYIIDDIRNTNEEDITVPTSTGYLLGLEYQLPDLFGKTTLHIEGADISQFTYKRWHPYLNFYSRRKLFSTSTGSNNFLDTPTGFFLGSDSAFIALWLTFLQDYTLHAELGYEMWFIGENSNIMGEDLINSYINSTESTRETYHNIRLDVSYTINSNIELSLKNIFITGDITSNFLSLFMTYKF